MSRVTIASDDKGEIKFETATSTGHGRLGQIKVATLFGRSYSLALTNETKSLNRGSFIDFLNAKAKNQNLPELKKGWFFGYFGSSDKEIKEVFDKIYSNADKELHNQIINKVNLQIDKGNLPIAKLDNSTKIDDLKNEKVLMAPSSHLLFDKKFVFGMATANPDNMEYPDFNTAIGLIFPENKNPNHQDHTDLQNFLLDIAIKNAKANELIAKRLEIDLNALQIKKEKRQEELAEQKK